MGHLNMGRPMAMGVSFALTGIKQAIFTHCSGDSKHNFFIVFNTPPPQAVGNIFLQLGLFVKIPLTNSILARFVSTSSNKNYVGIFGYLQGNGPRILKKKHCQLSCKCQSKLMIMFWSKRQFPVTKFLSLPLSVFLSLSLSLCLHIDIYCVV